eukprot:6518392-Pyramimonas_sp.AAC.2
MRDGWRTFADAQRRVDFSKHNVLRVWATLLSTQPEDKVTLLLGFQDWEKSMLKGTQEVTQENPNSPKHSLALPPEAL